MNQYLIPADFDEHMPRRMIVSVKQTVTLCKHISHGSGKTVRVWCEEQGVNQKSYYYWQQKIREALGERFTSEEGEPGLVSWKGPERFPARSCFAEVTPARGFGKDREAAVSLTMNGTLVEVHNVTCPPILVPDPELVEI